jgi:hypothetical protein
MSSHTDRRAPMDRLVRPAGVVLLVFVVTAAVLDTAIGGLFAVMLVGGVVMGGMLLWMTRHGRRGRSQPDAFARDTLGTDVINASRLRVAGLGGLGLVAGAAAVALQFQLTSVALLAGVTGGALGAAAVILYRRRRGPLGTSSQGPAARVMLVASTDEHVPTARADGEPRDRAPRVAIAGARP